MWIKRLHQTGVKWLSQVECLLLMPFHDSDFDLNESFSGTGF